jgi:hypothetical protein
MSTIEDGDGNGPELLQEPPKTPEARETDADAPVQDSFKVHLQD